jgi:MFS family permease
MGRADADHAPPSVDEERAGDDRAFAVLLVVTFIAITSTNAIRPTVTYHALALGGSAFDVGLVQSAFSILPVITAVAVGRAIDRAGERRFFAAALACLGLGSAVAAMSSSLLVLGVGQALMGFGAITMLIAGQVMVANRGPRGRRDQRYGTYTTVMAVGQLLGPAVAAGVLGSTGLGNGEPLVFAGSAAAVLLAAGIATLIPVGRPRAAPAAGDAPVPGIVRATGLVLRRPGMPAAMFVSIVIVSTVDVLAAYLPVYGEDAGLSVGLVGALLATRAGATLVSRIFMVRLIRALGRRGALTLSLVGSAVGLGLIPFTTEPVVLTVLMILGGLALGMGQPMTIAWVANRATRGDRATALSVRLTGNRAAMLVVPAAMGVVAGAAGVSAIFWAIAALLGSGAAVAATIDQDDTEPPVAGERAGTVVSDEG